MVSSATRRLLLAALLAVVAGCERDRTQIMIGLATDYRAPSEISYARLQVFRLVDADPLGFEIVKQGWDLGDAITLPGSFGLYSDKPEDVRVRIVAEAYTTLDANGLAVRRETVVSLAKNETRFLRLGLVAACGPKTCASTETCVEGACVGRELDVTQLPLYEPAADPTRDLTVALACDSGTQFIDTKTGAPMVQLAQSCATGVCREGICLAP